MPGRISLRPIDRTNWQECISLTVKPEQTGLVGANVRSLAEASVRPEATALGVFEDEKMVGFMMYLKNPDDNYYYIHRFMVDGRYQKRGIGRRALAMTVDQITLRKDHKGKIMLLFLVHNSEAERFYRAFGFKDTGKVIIDEKLFYLPLEEQT